MTHLATPQTLPAGVEAVVIGGSAGGVDALLEVLGSLPAAMQVPVICMLHIPASRESRLAEVFGPRLAVPVREAADKQPIAAGTVYFAGAGYHLSIEQDRSFSLSCEPPVHFARPAIDVLMNSAADVYGSALVGVLLTGANQDGAAGLAEIHARGGFTIVQDPAQAQVSTMPLAAIAASTPDAIADLAGIAGLLGRLVGAAAPVSTSEDQQDRMEKP